MKYLIVKNELVSSDTIVPFDINFFLKTGVNSGFIDIDAIIFKEGYFISFKDTTLKTNINCKFCKINIDSIDKIKIRGIRLHKKK